MKKNNYSDFKNFVRDNKSLSRTKIYEEYRKKGGKIRKQTALEIIRDMTGVERQKSKGKSVQRLIKEKTARTRHKITDKVYKPLDNPILKQVYNNIQKLYDNAGKKFLVVRIKSTYDDYSYDTNFQIYIPWTKDYTTARQLALNIISNMETYYKKLAMMYNDLLIQSKKETSLYALKVIKRQILNSRGLELLDVKAIFRENGFIIGDLQINEFV